MSWFPSPTPPTDECSLLAWIKVCLPLERFGIFCQYLVLADPVDLTADPTDQSFYACLRPMGTFMAPFSLYSHSYPQLVTDSNSWNTESWLDPRTQEPSALEEAAGRPGLAFLMESSDFPGHS